MPSRAAALHVPVLLREVVEYLSPRPGGCYLDGTLGLGGHSEAILAACGGRARLVGLDRDADALKLAGERLADAGAEVLTAHARYSCFADVLREHGISLLDGALLDVGVSSMQLDEAGRGFSFSQDGPLDMRMDRTDGVSAAGIVNETPAGTLARIIADYGEEPLAGRIAGAIAERRKAAPIRTTGELADVVAGAYPARWRATARNHPATRTFQALRIAVNHELEELEAFLSGIAEFLRPGARVCVITFHSLEDRLVKNAFRDGAKGCVCPPALPVCVCGHRPVFRVLTPRPVRPAAEEAAANPRAASARLRVAERVEG